MSRSVLVAAVVVALSLTTLGTASAADLGVRPAAVRAPSVLEPSYIWSGFYFGVHAGIGGDETKLSSPLVGTATATSSGGFAGGQLGYNWQSGLWVWGLETDIAWSDISARTTAGGFATGVDVDWFGTTRLRLGYTWWQRVMLYVTGGVAYGETTTFAGAFSQSTTKLGYAVGGGVEYAMLPNVSFKTEYLYVDLGDSTVTPLPVTETTTFHSMKAGLNWKFGPRLF